MNNRRIIEFKERTGYSTDDIPCTLYIRADEIVAIKETRMNPELLSVYTSGGHAWKVEGDLQSIVEQWKREVC